MREVFPLVTDAEVAARRGPRNRVDPRRPYAHFVDQERNASGEVVGVATILLSSSECRFRCLMCDLWKNTLESSVRVGDVPSQIRWALSHMDRQAIREVKLYNSGNFFDPRAVPEEDYQEIAELVRDFDTVIVENHPRLCGERCNRFRDAISPATLQIAIGLETCHPGVLKSLNKRMTLTDFDNAVDRLHLAGISTRVFLLHGVPYLSEQDAFDWTLRSIEYSFLRSVQCCSLIPTRGGNGTMDRLAKQGEFEPPKGESFEKVVQAGVVMAKQLGLPHRVFGDLWDAERLFTCEGCRDARIERLAEMNLTQNDASPIECPDCALTE